MTASVSYSGLELELFGAASKWKAYWSAAVAPYLGRVVVEVGSGLGANIPFLKRGDMEWICLEPDARLAGAILEKIASGGLPAGCSVVQGSLADLPRGRPVDTILYIDVLEHIAADDAELLLGASRLGEGGHLIVLAPAHQWLYSPFDRALGHHRRYTRATLRAAVPPDLELVALRYLDSVGLLASAGNRLLLRASMPTRAQIRIWDGLMVPASRLLDRILAHRVGKSVLGVWRRRG